MNIKKLFEQNGLSIVFLLLVAVCAVGGILIPDQKTSDTENRPLQHKPAFRMSALMQGNYQRELETYLSDQFPLRSTWVKIHANFEHQIGRNEINGIFIGKENMLFQESVVPGNTLIQQKQDALNAFAKKHQDLTISMLLAPNKATILEEYLPGSIASQNQQRYMQKFLKGLKDPIHVVDVSSSLKKHKNEYIYYRSDHHWTSKGAYQAFEAWKQAMLPDEKRLSYDYYTVNDSFYGTLANTSGYYRGKADHVEICTSKDDPRYTVKYASLKKASTSLFDQRKAAGSNPYEVFLSGNQPLIDISTTTENTKHLLILKDSYANSFIPYLLPYYSKITVVDPRYYYEDLEQLIQDREISDVLFLYNANTFFSDSSLQSVIAQGNE